MAVVDVAAMLVRPQLTWHSEVAAVGGALVLVGCATGSVLVRRDLAGQAGWPACC